MLVRIAKRIGPIVKNLAAKKVSAYPPNVLVTAKVLKPVMVGQHCIEVLRLER